MPSKQLMAVWGFLDFCMLVAGGITIAFSVLFKAPDAVRSLVLSQSDLNRKSPTILRKLWPATANLVFLVGLALGIVYCVTFVVSIGAVIQQNHITIGLAILNWILIIDGIVTVIYGSNLWFMTLREEHNFGTIWDATTPASRVAVQDKLQCCGFLNNTSIEPAGICANPGVAQAIGGCSTKFIAIADDVLMQSFS